MVRGLPTGNVESMERFAWVTVGVCLVTLGLISYSRGFTGYSVTSVMLALATGNLLGWSLQYRFTRATQAIADRWRDRWHDCMEEFYQMAEGRENDPFGTDKRYTTISIPSECELHSDESDSD